METYHIRNGYRLKGDVRISGAKNAVLPILAATIATEGESIIHNYPDISDFDRMCDILDVLGCKVTTYRNSVVIDSKNILKNKIDEELMSSMRSSVFLAGALLARTGFAEISKPGGCKIGARPIDIHINLLKQLGVSVEENERKITLNAKKLYGNNIVLPFPSVGATENAIIAASKARGDTVIENAAKEPEIVDLQNFLNSCGADIRGAGTNRIEISGKKYRGNVEYTVMPDRIEAGTFIAATIATRGDVLLRDIDIKYMSGALMAFRKTGAEIKEDKGNIRIIGNPKNKSKISVKTAPYPSFPTDLQPLLVSAALCSKAHCEIEENIFEKRFGYINQLNKIGANISVNGRKAIVDGTGNLQGGTVRVEDLRGGAALVVAALSIKEETVVEDIKYIKRGYSSFDKKLRSLGADIREKTVLNWE